MVVRLAGVPVFDRSDLWLIQRKVAPGERLAVEYVRGGELRMASAPASEVGLRGTGELGGAIGPLAQRS